MATLCSTGGWIVELWLRKLLGREMDPVGPALYGFVFSIGLTLLPIAIISLAKVTLILRTLFPDSVAPNVPGRPG